MKLLCSMLALVMVLAMSGLVMAKQKDAAGTPKVKAIKGDVVAVDGKNIKVKVKVKGETAAQEQTITVDDAAAITVDGKEGKLTDIQAGMRVTLTPDTGKATKVEATTAKAAKAGKGGKAAKAGA